MESSGSRPPARREAHRILPHESHPHKSGKTSKGQELLPRGTPARREAHDKQVEHHNCWSCGFKQTAGQPCDLGTKTPGAIRNLVAIVRPTGNFGRSSLRRWTTCEFGDLNPEVNFFDERPRGATGIEPDSMAETLPHSSQLAAYPRTLGTRPRIAHASLVVVNSRAILHGENPTMNTERETAWWQGWLDASDIGS